LAFGRYRLLERLGQGGMAEVFKAKSYGVEGFEKILVIKRILPELSKSQDFVDMFVHEAKLAVRLSHANIVQVFDLGKAPIAESGSPEQLESYYIAMEYVHGLDLASVLARSRRKQIPLSIQMSAYLASEIAKGLDHAHRRRDEQMRPLGIVHRDVSPQNVLLSFEGEVKVTDFGIAKARGVLDESAPEDTRARKLRGKFGYMSPEQSRGESVDARSDLFSLAAMVYECVTGVNPFGAPTTFETLRRVQACEYPPPELLRPDVPAELVAILSRAMARDPADRYSDAGRMYEALLAFLHAQGSRYGAHDLSEFLSLFREPSESPALTAAAEPKLETEGGHPRMERTPVEVPAARASSSIRPATGQRHVAIDRAVEMGERREVTALVIELARQTSVELVDRAAKVLERWGGYVLRREVGHIAALFGLGHPDGRDTEMATRCALVAVRSLEPTRPPGVGLHVGRVHVSSAGELTEDDRWGTLLDTARDLARVREGQVAMSTHAMRQVKSLFEFEPLGDSDRQAQTVSCLLVKDVRSPSDTLGRFVGRKDELRRIGVVLATAAKRKARVITIRGDHGVGKTRLLHEVERRLRRGGYDVGFHIATCPPRGNEFPLSGVVCMLHVLCGTTEGDAPDRILAVHPRLRALGLPGDEVRAVLLALGATEPTVAGDTGTLLRQAVTRVVHSLCADRSHTFVWDVAHAMDDDSFALLEEVFRRSSQSRVVFVLAARAGFAHPLEKAEGHVAIDLSDLAAPEVERLVALRLGVESVPDELLRFVRTRAGGHPLFLEEVIEALVEAGAVSVGERRVVSMKLVSQDLALPKTLRGLVASRVARLSTEDRTTLQAAAVLGDPIDVAVLSSMLGQAVPSLERSLVILARRDFVVYGGPSELRFTSPVVPEVVADALTHQAAREMHAAAGRALEETLGERAWEQAARIAGHLYEACDRERAAVYFAKSGERRLITRQLEAAARDYARAIALAGLANRTPEELVAWLEGLASAVRLVRFAPDAKELCGRVIDVSDRAGARDSRVRARVAAGHILAAVHQIEDGRMRLAEAASIAQNDMSLMKPVLLAEAELATRQGDFRRALVLLDELRRVVQTSSDEEEGHRVALQFAQSHAAVGDRATALANLQEAERLLPGDRTAALERTKVHALVDYFTRDLRSAALRSEEAIHLGRDMGLAHEVMLNLHNLGEILVHLDDLPRAYGAIQQSLALCEESGDERFANYNRMLLAFLDGVQGTDSTWAGVEQVAAAVDSAEGLLRQGIAYAQSHEFTWDVIGGRLLLAKLLRRMGHLGAARGEYEKTHALAAEAGHRLVADDCAFALEELACREAMPASAIS
jgi:serine/threonine protein kinase/tetratricopeptide (TPR) repeat protein